MRLIVRSVVAADLAQWEGLWADRSMPWWPKRKGVRALIAAVYERAQRAGCLQVYWQTHESNLTAMALYDQVAERSGFLVYQRSFDPTRAQETGAGTQ
jgi:GNAT superfamily N-acetyltransferase